MAAVVVGKCEAERAALPSQPSLDLPTHTPLTPFPPPAPPPHSSQVCIEDPFEVSHDLGRTVDRQTRAVLHKEFTRAATLLRDADDPLDQLFQPYRAGSRNGS